jgi:hypothetical protein
MEHLTGKRAQFTQARTAINAIARIQPQSSIE